MRRVHLSIAAALFAGLSPQAPLTAQRSAAAAPAVAVARTMPAGRYEFTTTDDDGDVTTGAVSWLGSQMRIDMDRSRNRTGPRSSAVNASNRRGEYILVDLAANMVRTVKPQEREISEMPLATFEQIIGKALGMVGAVVQMQVRNAGILAKDVGPGGTVAGVQTQQFRLIEEYSVRVGVFGMNAEEKRHRVVTDYWVSRDPAPPRNPLVELTMRAASAMSQQDAAHQANVSRARAALFSGAPMKVVVTATEAGESAKRSSMEITSLSTVAPAATVFALPSGYTVKRNDLNVTI